MGIPRPQGMKKLLPGEKTATSPVFGESEKGGGSMRFTDHNVITKGNVCWGPPQSFVWPPLTWFFTAVTAPAFLQSQEVLRAFSGNVLSDVLRVGGRRGSLAGPIPNICANSLSGEQARNRGRHFAGQPSLQPRGPQSVVRAKHSGYAQRHPLLLLFCCFLID